MKPLFLIATGVPNCFSRCDPRESARLFNSRPRMDAQKATGWPFVLKLLVDFAHFRPELRSPFAVHRLEGGFCLLTSVF
jgi:hypothetical protein